MNELEKPGISTKASLAIILGSGMGEIISEARMIDKRTFNEIPSLKKPTVESHKGEILIMDYEGKEFVLVKGRVHYYEGHCPEEVSKIIEVLAALGINKIIITNASGGVESELKEGDLFLIEDQINFQFSTPLHGRGKNKKGVQFVDMSRAFDVELRKKALDISLQYNIALKKGVYLGLKGPTLETNAEYKMLKILGCDAVGMSTVPEVLLANFLGLKCLGISVISNVFEENDRKGTSIENVIKTVNKSNSKLSLLLKSLIKEIA